MLISLNVLEIEPDGCHLMLNATIRGLKANVLIDTGASKTIMDVSRAKHYLDNPVIQPLDKHFAGIGAGRVQTWVTRCPKITLGDIDVADLQLVLIDLKPINASYAIYDLPRIDIVMGGDLLRRFGAVIDYGNNSLKISKNSD
jgi:hypothetical protein